MNDSLQIGDREAVARRLLSMGVPADECVRLAIAVFDELLPRLGPADLRERALLRAWWVPDALVRVDGNWFAVAAGGAAEITGASGTATATRPGHQGGGAPVRTSGEQRQRAPNGETAGPRGIVIGAFALRDAAADEPAVLLAAAGLGPDDSAARTFAASLGRTGGADEAALLAAGLAVEAPAAPEGARRLKRGLADLEL